MLRIRVSLRPNPPGPRCLVPSAGGRGPRAGASKRGLLQLESLRIQSWRSLRDLKLDLAPGLNVIAGPNEAGKSSIREALRSAFLVPTKQKGKHPLTAVRPWDNPQANPSVELTFVHEGARYRLERIFFGEGSSLEKDGTMVAKDDAVLAYLAENRLSLALLWAAQGDVEPAAVPSELRPQLAASEAVTPGVAWLEGRLNELWEEFWTPTGRVKKSHADARETLVRREAERDELTQELKASDRLSREVVALRAELEELRARESRQLLEVERQRPLLTAWESHRKRLAEFAVAQGKVQARRRWEEYSARLAELRSLQQQYTEGVALMQARVQAVDRGGVEALQARLAALQAREQAQLQKELAELRAPAPADVARLEGLEGRIQGLEQALLAGAWDAELAARDPLNAGLDGQTLTLGAGETHRWTSATGFTLELPGARLTLRAGKARAELDALREQRMEMLLGWRASSLAEARERVQRAADLRARVRPGSAVEVPPDVAELSDWEATRELAELPERITRAESDWKAATEGQTALARELQELIARNPGPLIEQTEAELARLERTEEVPDLETLRLALSPPEGGEVSEATLAAAEGELTRLRSQAQEVEGRLQQGVGRLSAGKDLYTRWVRAEEAWAREKAAHDRRELEARSARLLLESFGAARRRVESDLVAPLHQRIQDRLSQLTGSRYRDVSYHPDLRTESLVMGSGQDAPLGELSFGTREQVAFISRLALAEMLSQREPHLTIFDDNLVHTDPQRLEVACRLLLEASAKAQVLVLTCHPERFSLLRLQARWLTL